MRRAISGKPDVLDCAPHFEKMLYDNSQLARVYLHAWQVTGNEFFRTITEEILDYVAREMTDPAGGFYSTQDADSEGQEGKFFVWTPDEIREVLGEGADEFMAAYDVTPGGNFEGKNILEFVGDMDQRSALAEARQKLFEAREIRVHPSRDDVQLALAPTAKQCSRRSRPHCQGADLVERPDAGCLCRSGARLLPPSPGTGRGDQGVRAETHRQIAERNADFLLRELRQGNRRLLRTWERRPERVLEGPSEGAGEAKLNGYLEDYSYLIEGLLELYQTTFDPRWFVAAQELAETMIIHFKASEGVQLARTGQLPSDSASRGGIGVFCDTSDDHEMLITRPRDLQDNATPSGNAMAVTTLLKLAGFTDNLRYVDIAHQALAQIQPMISQYPLSFGQWLQALAYALSEPREIAIVGDHDSANTQALLRSNLSGAGYEGGGAVGTVEWPAQDGRDASI